MLNIAIITGAEKGIRIGKKSKPFLLLDNEPLLNYSLKIFNKCKFIDKIIVVVNKDKVEFANNSIIKLKLDKEYTIIPGGKTRQDSVYQAIKSISNVTYVLVHDAARPLITLDLVTRVFEATKKYGASIPTIPVCDTIKKGEHYVEQTLDRKLLGYAQTPQGFKYTLLKEAYHSAIQDNHLGTDDSSLVERIGHKVKIVPGTQENIKITYPSDLIIAKGFLEKIVP